MNNTEIERRFLASELRANAEITGWTLTGYAAVFDSRSEDLGGFTEVIKRGAFRNRKSDVLALFNHSNDYVLGRESSGTLKVEEDNHGLKVTILLPDTTTAKDLYTSVSRGDIRSMSFAFTVNTGGETWSKDSKGKTVRTLTDVELFDVSIVTVPAYPSTSVNARQLAQKYTDSELDNENAKRHFELDILELN